ncbi:MAG: DinB family protein [Phycisphaerae bacterium]|nr:DinB family protein [Phycisphaerae bacterium]
MAKWPWIERRFTFDFPVTKHPDIVERFRGLPARIEERARGLTRDQLTRSDGRGWSIQENIGHLLALESLFDGRLDDFAAGKPELRPADMQNLATTQANYNAREIALVLADLRAARFAQCARLEVLSESDFARVSVHPRLKMPMRLIDAVCFVCEHDDYHMARIAELRRGLGV